MFRIASTRFSIRLVTALAFQLNCVIFPTRSTLPQTHSHHTYCLESHMRLDRARYIVAHIAHVHYVKIGNMRGVQEQYYRIL